ncbi:hypothetical protein H6S82_11495 [Planktothrix sp. FACHB-1355]|uniref:NB-ARC domain-containing protein n=1 Tax=Aerosakkonema funiforme FACHB-1375 TaxID=2949571 RepID=A0A926VAW1_9CYAN|nr:MULTISPECIES: NB-ARC domain-containing protein [Oscillatoriales]MBD2180295.1 hypothetical protein [Aerosakkonema funiforme FACHB-1375]MBD3559481.1 hypothetical protein [Planktothrix sp. FACHB-1355]
MSVDEVSSEENYPDLQQMKQSILENVQVGGNLTTGDNIQNISIYQSEPPKPVGIPQNIPYTGATDFVGRSKELETLHQKLQRADCVAISAIAGMGGVGKTELAIQYALAHRETYQGGICWLQALEQDVGTQIVNFTQVHLGLNPPKDIKELRDQVRWCWQHWQEGNVLVILDDVNDYTQLKPYLPPPASRFRVLLTTRLRLLKSSERLELNVLAPDAAIALLESLIGIERVQGKLEVARELCQWLGCLPLGLELVGRYLDRKSSLSLAEMQRRLHEKRLEQQALKTPKSESDMTAHLGVAAAFELSWKELSPAAKELGCFLSLFDLVPISWLLVEQCFPDRDPEELEEIRDDFLLDLHLIQHEAKETYRLHELIREFLHTKLVESKQTNNLNQAIALTIAAIVQRNPVCLTEILKKRLLDWSFTQDISQPSALELGWQVRIATQAWIDGIGSLANLVVPRHNDGSLPPLGVRLVQVTDTDVHYTYFQTGWYFGTDSLEDVVELSPEVEKLFAEHDSGFAPEVEKLFTMGWNYFTSTPLKQQASGAWQRTFEQIVDSLSQLLQQRSLPVEAGYLSLEAAWHAALHLSKRHHSYANPIPLDEIEAHLSKVRNSCFSLMMQHCLNQLRIEVESCRAKGETYLSLPSSVQAFRTTQVLSPELLLAYTADIYQGAIEGYQQLVNTLFPKFLPKLQLASILPARLVGVVVPPHQGSDSVSISWYWERLPFRAVFLDNSRISSRFFGRSYLG